MDHLHDFGLVAIAIGGVGILFKFLLDAFAKHLERLETSWRVEADRVYNKVEAVETKLDNHIRDEETHWERNIERLKHLVLEERV
jgi:hypothetical protein